MTIDIVEGNEVLGSITAKLHTPDLRRLIAAIVDKKCEIVGPPDDLGPPFRVLTLLRMSGYIQK